MVPTGNRAAWNSPASQRLWQRRLWADMPPASSPLQWTKQAGIAIHDHAAKCLPAGRPRTGTGSGLWRRDPGYGFACPLRHGTLGSWLLASWN
jgi:hypothetical protein